MLPPKEQASLRESLERVLASPEFLYAEKLRRFLRYSFEESLKRDPELSERRVGVEVFDCADGYDPAQDPIVPLEARRLRQKPRLHLTSFWPLFLRTRRSPSSRPCAK